ncbi:MAG: class I SAM-dependent methyltransferase [Hyphomicrobium sp.]|nr:class I SAM-dependent methyltransferase [Hyphomicrobium sp.]
MTETAAAQIAARFPGVLKRMLESGTAQGANGPVKFVGGSTLNNLFILDRLFDAVAPSATLEVGLACGASALLFCDKYRRAGQDAHRQHVALDPFQHELDEAGMTQLGMEALDGYVQLVRQPSLVALPQLLAEGRTFQLIYIDGSHHFEDVFIDLIYATHLLDEGGVMAFDDSTWPDVAKALQFLRRNFKGVVEEIDLMEFRPEDRRTLRAKVAQALGRAQMTAFRKVGQLPRHWSQTFRDF